MRTADTSVVHFDLHAYGLRFAYDLNGRRTRLAYPAWLMPAGRDSVRVAYDAVTGAPARLTDWYGQAYEFRHDLVGRLDTLRLPGGITERRSYFADGALRSRLEGSATRRLHEDELTYDARGKILNAVALIPETEIADQFPSRYDGMGALVYARTFAEAPVVEQFALDAMGNVASKVRSGGGTGAEGSDYSYEAGTGRLLVSRSESVIQGRTDSTTRAWDPAGQLTWETRRRHVPVLEGWRGLRDSSYSWYGADGTLRAVELVRDTMETPWPAYREHEEYWYDALGRRVWVRMHRGAGCAVWAKETGCRSSVTRTVWDDAALLAEIRTPATSPEADTGTNSGAHAGRVAYLNGGAIDRPLALLRLAYGTEVILPHRNYRGLVDTGTCLLGAIDCTTIEWPARTYTAYMASPTASDTGPAQWMGSVVTEQKDGSGLLYRRNRYYDPATGRFTQEDPIGLAGGLNLYGYAGGDPVNFSDPFGLCPVCDIADFGFFAHSAYKAWKDPSRQNLRDLALDGVGLLPIVPSIGMVRRIGDAAEFARKIPGKKHFRGPDGPAAAYAHLKKNHGVNPNDASHRLHKLKEGAGMSPDDDVVIGATGDVYNARSGERLGTLTDKSLGSAKTSPRDRQ